MAILICNTSRCAGSINALGCSTRMVSTPPTALTVSLALHVCHNDRRALKQQTDSIYFTQFSF